MSDLLQQYQEALRQYNQSLSHVLPKAVGTNLLLWSSVSVCPFRLCFHRPSAHSDPSARYCSPLQHSTSTKQGISLVAGCSGHPGPPAPLTVTGHRYEISPTADYASVGRLRTKNKVPCWRQEATLGTHSFLATPSPSPSPAPQPPWQPADHPLTLP